VSLDFSYKKCIDNGTLTWEELVLAKPPPGSISNWTGIGFTMPFLMMAIGKQNITEKNAEEVWQRAYLWQKVNGCLARVGGEPFYVSREMVYKCIGMTTNVFPEYSKTKFFDNLTRDIPKEV
jgi:hypothetical protein